MFSTDHLPLAAYLTTAGFKAIATRNPNSSRVIFNFDEADQANVTSAIDLYQSGKALVEPGLFEQNRIILRRQIERLQEGG